MDRVTGWFEERLELSKLAWLGTRKVPRGVTWWYTLGSATLVAFMMLVATGVFLVMNYSPTPDHAWDSLEYLTNEVKFGLLVRSIHHWSAYAMILLIGLHGARVFFMAAYRYPRELTWMVGVILLLLVTGMGFTGYLLPWDQKAYWATQVGTRIVGEAPFVGHWMKTLLTGGDQLGTLTLSRFFTFHTLVIPALIAVFIAFHLFLVVRQGISTPPTTKQ